MLGTYSRTLARIAHLETFLDAPVRLCWRGLPLPPVEKIVGWGLKKTTLHAGRVAQRKQLPFVRLEDGFLRSLGLGKQSPPLSVVVDDVGIYYDATHPSRLEGLIPQRLEAGQIARADALIKAWRAARVSKYNHLRESCTTLPQPYVLVADQTFGDASIAYGQADADTFSRMLAAALDENPDATIVVKIHPDVFAGKKRGHFDPRRLAAMPRVKVLAKDAHPVSLIEGAAAVYVVTSQMGFEGLLWGKPVRTFGMPFYAGWGLTVDALPSPERRGAASLEQLVHAALVDYPRYVDPETGKRCEVERLLEWMALQRRMSERFAPVLHAVGFSAWKRPILRDFVRGSDLHFVKSGNEVGPEETAVIWGMKDHADPLHRVPDGTAVIRVEDGFLRSVGLGAELIRPLSWVIDSRGIYYDAGKPSDLEHLLEHAVFDQDLLLRAATLRQRIVAERLTKYNIGSGTWQRPREAQRVILVPGQVESDASLAFGAPRIRRNLELLRAVRERCPDAYVVYKPHPDVVAGLRELGEDEDSASRWCDEVVIDLPMANLLDHVDEVHALTSLAGFEALLRGLPVTCYGLPFYAGWGLTADECATPRRTRKRSLDELVAASLILYPSYVSRSTGCYATPERILDELRAWRTIVPETVSLWQKLRRRVLRWV